MGVNIRLHSKILLTDQLKLSKTPEEPLNSAATKAATKTYDLFQSNWDAGGLGNFLTVTFNIRIWVYNSFQAIWAMTSTGSQWREQHVIPEVSAQRGVWRAVFLWWSCCRESSGLGRRQWSTKERASKTSPRGIATAPAGSAVNTIWARVPKGHCTSIQEK